MVVATANHPEDLDEAILKRPGRFDRVIRFALPDAAMRSRILTDLYAAESPSGGLEPDLLAELIDATDGFSMAAMKEFFIASANEAFQAGSACITAEHTREALNILKRQHTHAASGKRIGF